MSSATSRTSSSSGLLVILVLLFAGTLLLRLRGIDWMLPHSVEPDVHLAVQVEGFRGQLQDWEGGVDYGKYPHLLARMLQPFSGGVAPSELSGEALRAPVEAHLRRAMGTVLEVRYLIALLGALLAPLTFLLARRFMPTRGALLAAGLVAFSLLHQHYSQQARPHVASATLALLAVLASLHLRRRPTLGVHALTGLAAALSVASLHNGLAVVLPVAVAHWLTPRPAGPQDRGPQLGRRLARLLLLGLPSLVALRLAYPFFFTPRPEQGGGLLTVESGGVSQSGHSIEWSQFNGAGFGRVLEALVSFEPILLGLVVVGLLALAVRVRAARASAHGESWRDLLIVLAYALPYLLVIGLFSLTYQRFVVPLLPYLALCAAWGFTRCDDWLSTRLGSRPDIGSRAGIALLLLILLPPAWVTWRLGSLRSAPDNFERAAAWLAENTAADTPRVVVSHGSDLPLAREPEAVRLDAALPRGVRPELWVAYQTELLAAAGPNLPLFESGRALLHLPLLGRRDARRLRRDLGAWLAELEAGLLVVPADEKVHDAVAWYLREYAQREAELLVRFSTEADERFRTYPFSYATFEGHSAAPQFALRTLRAQAVGPTVEIYRLPAASEE